MRAVIVREHGGLDALRIEQLPEPSPGPTDVVVAVRAVGINHLDLWVRRGVPGHTFPLPLIPGNDVAGVVHAIGSAVDGLAIGDEVVLAPGTSCGQCPVCLAGHDHRCRDYGIFGETRHGGCADLIVAPRSNVFAKPTSLSFVEAAAVGIPFLTAWHMLLARAQLGLGETVLVQAGGSGVGSAAIQIAKLLHARVITTVGSETKAARARELGADHVINYRETSVASEIKRLTAGRGVDVVVEHVGAATWEDSARALAWHGRLVTCGATTGAEVKLNLRRLFFKAQSFLGSTMGSKAEFAAVLAHAGAARVQPVIDRVLPMTAVRDAHQLLEERRVFGRLVLTQGGEIE